MAKSRLLSSVARAVFLLGIYSHIGGGAESAVLVGLMETGIEAPGDGGNFILFERPAADGPFVVVLASTATDTAFHKGIYLADVETQQRYVIADTASGEFFGFDTFFPGSVTPTPGIDCSADGSQCLIAFFARGRNESGDIVSGLFKVGVTRSEDGTVIIGDPVAVVEEGWTILPDGSRVESVDPLPAVDITTGAVVFLASISNQGFGIYKATDQGIVTVADTATPFPVAIDPAPNEPLLIEGFSSHVTAEGRLIVFLAFTFTETGVIEALVRTQYAAAASPAEGAFYLTAPTYTGHLFQDNSGGTFLVGDIYNPATTGEFAAAIADGEGDAGNGESRLFVVGASFGQTVEEYHPLEDRGSGAGQGYLGFAQKAPGENEFAFAKGAAVYSRTPFGQVQYSVCRVDPNLACDENFLPRSGSLTNFIPFSGSATPDTFRGPIGTSWSPSENDEQSITYFTPKFTGFQLGASYSAGRTTLPGADQSIAALFGFGAGDPGSDASVQFNSDAPTEGIVDEEIFFMPSITLDNGIQIGGNVQLEAAYENGSADAFVSEPQGLDECERKATNLFDCSANLDASNSPLNFSFSVVPPVAGTINMFLRYDHPDDSNAANNTDVAVVRIREGPADPTLSVSVAGTGDGNVSDFEMQRIDCGAGGADCEHTYAVGASETLIAEAGAGSLFGDWAGCDSVGSISRDCSLTMNESRSVTATFLDAKSAVKKLQSDLDLVSDLVFGALALEKQLMLIETNLLTLNLNGAKGQLRGFIKLLGAMIRNGLISEAEGTPLLLFAEDIFEVLDAV